MPSLMAVALALLAGLTVEWLLEPYVPLGIKAAISLVAFFGTANVTRRYLVRLRHGGG